MTGYVVSPIGVVRSARTEPEPDRWGDAVARIELDARFGPEAVRGLEAFSHVEVLYRFHLADEGEVCTGARHPRGDRRWPAVGIFAQRGRMRPNLLGSTICRLERVEGTVLHLRELDAVDGTPVLDVKPVLRAFLPREAVRQPGWADEVMAAYWTPAGGPPGAP